MADAMSPEVRKVLNRGVAIPAHPLALTAGRKLESVVSGR